MAQADEYCILFNRISGPNVHVTLTAWYRALEFIRVHAPDSPALLMEPRSIFDAAIVGVTNVKDCDHWSRSTSTPIVIYDPELCIRRKVHHGDFYAIDDDMGDYAAAADAFYYNRDGWVGKGTPTFLDMLHDGLVERTLRARLQRVKRKLYLYARSVGWFSAKYKAAKARVEFAPGGLGARAAAEEFKAAAAAAAGDPPLKRQRTTKIKQQQCLLQSS